MALLCVPSSLDRLALVPRHVVCMPLNSELPNLPDAGGSVRPEDETEQFGHDIVELPAVLWIVELTAVGTSGELLLDAARSHFAPGCSVISVTPWTPILPIGSARPTVETTMCNEGRVRNDFFHISFSCTTCTSDHRVVSITKDAIGPVPVAKRFEN